MSKQNNPFPLPPTPPPQLLTTDQAAHFLNVKPSTLEQWRWNGRGPKFCKIGRNCRYRTDDLLSYVDERCVSSTTEPFPDKTE